MRCASELLLLFRLKCWRWANRRQSDPKHCLAIPERIILHDLRFQANSDKIDKFSVPVLDYTIQIIKENPEYLVYVRVRSSIPTKATSIPTLS
jgi:hypothetical protein